MAIRILKPLKKTTGPSQKTMAEQMQQLAKRLVSTTSFETLATDKNVALLVLPCSTFLARITKAEVTSAVEADALSAVAMESNHSHHLVEIFFAFSAVRHHNLTAPSLCLLQVSLSQASF